MQLAKQPECAVSCLRIASNRKGKLGPSRTAGIDFFKTVKTHLPCKYVGVTSGSWLWSPEAVAS